MCLQIQLYVAFLTQSTHIKCIKSPFGREQKMFKKCVHFWFINWWTIIKVQPRLPSLAAHILPHFTARKPQSKFPLVYICTQ